PDGRVIELNWRATYILTARRDLAIVPNSTIAKSKIVNVSSPSGLHGSAVTVQVDSQTSPSRCSEILEHAVRNSRLIVATPAPTITVKTINASYAEFEIAFFVEELASTIKAQNELFDFIHGTWPPPTSTWQRPRTGRWRTGTCERAAPVSNGCSSWLTSLQLSRQRNARPSPQNSSDDPTMRTKRWLSAVSFCNHCL